MNSISKYFESINEPFASAFFENIERSKFYRFSKAYAHFFECCTLPEYSGGQLYPNGYAVSSEYNIVPHYSHTVSVNYKKLSEKCSEEALEYIKKDMDIIEFPPTPHSVGGYGFVHSFPNYARIEREGLNSYKNRIENLEHSDFRNGLLLLLDGIETYHKRILEKLISCKAPQNLISALEKVPFKPAGNLYEAMVCRNFVYYLDFCDNPGRIDAELIDFYDGEDFTEIFREFFTNVDINDGWSLAIGSEYNELTVQVLRAANGMRRPSVELRVTQNMPDSIWNEAIATIKTGGGSPSLYNEELYQEALKKRFKNISQDDLKKFNGGGCTETMLAGISRVGSLDAGINTALVLRNSITKYLTASESFEDFYEKFFCELKAAIEDTIEKVNYIYRQRIENMPQPIRTLLVDDCIDNEMDFNAGGARYNWSVINFAGIINVIDSFLAIRELVYDKKSYSPDEFLRLLDNEDKEFYKCLRKCECFGVDNKNADNFAAEFSDRLFGMLDDYKPVFGECFLPASIQFITYIDAGKDVGATPDGRKSGEPLCDSITAVHGKDVEGPTALLNSVTKLKLSKALGTPVLNFSIAPEYMEKALKYLAETYFEMGGMQMQITCVSKEDMLDALKHPEKHENLIVRVGGYSEYFNRLSDEMKRTVIERTLY